MGLALSDLGCAHATGESVQRALGQQHGIHVSCIPCVAYTALCIALRITIQLHFSSAYSVIIAGTCVRFAMLCHSIAWHHHYSLVKKHNTGRAEPALNEHLLKPAVCVLGCEWSTCLLVVSVNTQPSIRLVQ